MQSKFSNKNRVSPKRANSTSISTSQRASCVAVFYRWENSKISAIEAITAIDELKEASRDPSKNLIAKKNITVVKHDIIRCNTSKTKAASSGQFTLNLKRGKEIVNGVITKKDINYLEVINPGDWVMIYMKKSGEVQYGSTGESSGFKLLGIVENVRYVETDDPLTGMPRLEYVVSGKDFGKVFDSKIFFNPLLAGKTAETLLGVNFLNDAVKAIKGADRGKIDPKDALTPDNIIKKLVTFYLGMNSGIDNLSVTNEPWYIPATLTGIFSPKKSNRGVASFCDLLETNKIGFLKYVNGNITAVNSLLGSTLFTGLPSSGSVWSILQYLQNPLINEMFTELIPDSSGNLKPNLVLRQLPFSNKTTHETNAFFQAKKSGSKLTDSALETDKSFFIELPRFIINSSDIKQKNIGKSDFERINHIIVVPRSDFAKNLEMFYTSAVNTASVQRHGLRTFSGQTAYVFEKEKTPSKVCEKFLNLMIDWFFMNHELYNGTIIIDGKDRHIQIGQNLYIEDIGQLFHIEAVSHTYEVTMQGQTKYTTSLSVSRGQQVRGKVASFIGPTSGKADPTTISTSVIEGTRI